jgi:site-specific recombinase XerD
LALRLRVFLRDKEGFVFCSKDSRKLSTRSIRKIFEKYSSQVGRKITAEMLRQEHIRNELLSGKSPGEVRNEAGLKRLDAKKYVTKREFESIRTCARKGRDRIILDILFETGCLLKEITNIRVNDLRLSEKTIQIGFARKRESTISKRLSLQLKEFIISNALSGRDFLILTRQSKRASEKRVFQIVKDCSSKAGFSLSNPRVLRYSCIANLLYKGRSIEEISKQTGIRNLDKLHLYGSLQMKKHD